MEEPEMHAIIRATARSLRYETIDHLIGTQIKIAEIETSPEIVRNEAQRRIPQLQLSTPHDFDVQNRKKVFARYGFFGLRFWEHSRSLQSVPLGGISLLRELGFVFSSDELGETKESSRFEDESDISYLQMLLDEISREQLFLLVWLAEPDLQRPEWIKRLRSRSFLERLPVTLTITDACLTNAPYSWFNRHFYW